MTDLQNVHQEIALALADLAKLFKPGMKLTFIARHPEHGERHVIVTDDDLPVIAELLLRADDKPEVRLS